MRARAMFLAPVAVAAALILLIAVPGPRVQADGLHPVLAGPECRPMLSIRCARGPLGPGGPRVAAAPAFPPHSVLPVLLVPPGDRDAGAEAAAVAAGLEEVRRWYGEQLGRTFVLNDVQVVRTERPPGQGPTLLDAVQAELGRRGYPTGPAAGLITVAFVRGAGGFAAGAAFTGPARGGFALLGDDAIDGLRGRAEAGPGWWEGRRRQLGAIAHELGHTWGLHHPDPGRDGRGYGGRVMGAWWDFPAVGLGPGEKAALLARGGPFFRDQVEAAA